jgi:hypothetical protein
LNARWPGPEASETFRAWYAAGVELDACINYQPHPDRGMLLLLRFKVCGAFLISVHVSQRFTTT